MSWNDDGNELVVDGPTTFPVSRRDFLKLTSTGVLVLISADAFAGQETARPQTGRQSYPTDVNAYLHIGADSRVTCFVGKVELGQGPMTSLSQLLAEDLDVALSSVDIVCGDTDLCPWDMGTFGSLSVRAFGPVLRAAAAEARGVLMAMADAMGAAGSVVHRPAGYRGGTIESKTNFFSAARGPVLRGVCIPLHVGRTTSVWQTTITDAHDRMVAMVVQTTGGIRTDPRSVR